MENCTVKFDIQSRSACITCTAT